MRIKEENILSQEQINISHLAKGVYQIKFEGDQKTEIRKLIKE